MAGVPGGKLLPHLCGYWVRRPLTLGPEFSGLSLASGGQWVQGPGSGESIVQPHLPVQFEALSVAEDRRLGFLIKPHLWFLSGSQSLGLLFLIQPKICSLSWWDWKCHPTLTSLPFLSPRPETSGQCVNWPLENPVSGTCVWEPQCPLTSCILFAPPFSWTSLQCWVCPQHYLPKPLPSQCGCAALSIWASCDPAAVTTHHGHGQSKR